jgi:hypothetical protein
VPASEVTFYSVVVFAHVFAAVAGLGITFAYPLLWTVARSRYPRSLPFLFASQNRIGKTIIGPLVGLLIASGLYMVISEDGGFGFDALFVQVGLPIAVYVFFMGPLYFSPREAKLAELADRDIAAAGPGVVVLSDEFNALYRQVLTVSSVSIALIAVAIFFMAVKP